jgi:hypothetical protein
MLCRMSLPWDYHVCWEGKDVAKFSPELCRGSMQVSSCTDGGKLRQTSIRIIRHSRRVLPEYPTSLHQPARYTCTVWCCLKNCYGHVVLKIFQMQIHVPFDLWASDLRIFATTNHVNLYIFFSLLYLFSLQRRTNFRPRAERPLRYVTNAEEYSKFWCLHCNYSNCCTM